MKKLVDKETFVHITPDEAVFRETTLQWAKPTEELSFGLTGSFIPPQLRWMSPDERFVVLEFPPSYMMVHTTNSMGKGRYTGPQDKAMYRVPTPWSVYIVQPDNLTGSVFARPVQLTSLDDEVYSYHMCNLHCAGDFCLGNTADLRGCNTALEKAFKIVWHFWQTTFSGGFYTLTPNSHPPDPYHQDKFSGKTREQQRALYIPDEVLHSGVLGEISGVWADTDKYFSFLETVSLAEICQWSWKPHGTVEEMLAMVGYSPKTKYHVLRDLVTRGRAPARV